MQTKVKLTKRQIKEDKFTTFMLTAKNELQDKWEYYAIGLVALILIVGGISYAFSYYESKDAEAATSFAEAVREYHSGNKQPAIIAFNQVIDDYSGSPEAGRATCLLGNLYLSDRNYVEAEKNYQLYLKDYGDDPFQRATAQAGLAVAAENQGKYADAAELFGKAIAEEQDGPMESDYRLGAIRNYILLNQLDQANEQLGIMEDKFPNQDQTRQAIRLVAENSVG